MFMILSVISIFRYYVITLLRHHANFGHKITKNSAIMQINFAFF